MRSLRRLVPAAAALAAAALLAAPAGAQGDLQAAAAAAKKKAAAQTQTKPVAKKKVWTNADLEALRKNPGSQVLVLESRRIGRGRVEVKREAPVKPQQVVDGYARQIDEADRKLAELQREKLAGSNPYLRGLASQSGGPRSAGEIEADIKRWSSRRSSAQTNLRRAQALTGKTPTETAEPAR